MFIILTTVFVVLMLLIRRRKGQSIPLEKDTGHIKYAFFFKTDDEYLDVTEEQTMTTYNVYIDGEWKEIEAKDRKELDELILIRHKEQRMGDDPV